VRMLLIAAHAQSQQRFQESAWEANVTVDAASGPAEAAELAGVGDYDVVFVDMEGSAHDRVTLTAAVRWKFPVARIVLLDVWHGASDRILVLDAGADEVLEKPLEPAELTAKMRAMNRGESGPGPRPPIRSELVLPSWRLTTSHAVLAARLEALARDRTRSGRARSVPYGSGLRA
jgi:DNA-binding response OmpR family regulator